MNYYSVAHVALMLLACTTSAVAQRDLKDIPNPDPELERKSFIVADGFEVNLYAADPLIAKPIQMNFDAQGRLWVASSEIYPHIAPGQKANDKIVVLEDRDGDGASDHTQVFADGLLIPTGVEPGDGGAYVANSTELVHLADTNGDGRADRRRVMLSGFGTEDTHHILHTFRWGADGMLYFNQSIYIHSHIETPHGVRRLGGGGIWQFRPETMQLEVFSRGFVNTWGHHFDRFGQSLATDGAYGEGVNFVFPGATFVTAPGAKRILKGLNPGSPKHCGLEIVSGRHLPESWQGNVITNDFRGHRVCRFVISEDGSGFASREQPELIKTTHVAFRPIDVKMGPDGAIYIADWYNPIIQHGEVDFRDPRRDHTHGRIWRVTAKGRPLVKPPQLTGASVESLLEALKAPEEWTRLRAKRLLKERGAAKVVPALTAWLSQLAPDDPNVEHHRLEGLWTYQSLDVVEAKLLAALLRSHDHRVRAAATRVLGLWHDRIEQPLALLETQIHDQHPRVRLEAACALRNVPEPRSIELAMQALDHPVDAFLDFALWDTARQLQNVWLPALESGKLTFGDNTRHLTFALQAVDSPAVVPPLVALLESGQLPKEREPELLPLIASLGTPADLTMALERTLAWDDVLQSQRAASIEALAEISLRRQIKPTGDLEKLTALFDSSLASERIAAARAAGAWQASSFLPRLVEQALASGGSAALRRASIEALGRFANEQSRRTLEKLTEGDASDEIQIAAVKALAEIDVRAAAERTAAALEGRDAEQANTTPLWSTFLERKQGPAALAAAIKGRKLKPDTARLGLRLARSAANPYPPLIEALQAAAGLSAGPQQLSPAEMQTLVADVARHGDAHRGEEIFRRGELACFKCHSIAGAGGRVGPDLLSLGASAQVDYLVDSILQPSKQIKENYHSVVVSTSEGKVLTGVKVRQTDRELILRDAEDREVAVLLDTIDEQAPGASIMPVGAADALTRRELVDLVKFLSSLGKVGDFAVGRERAVRRWQVLEPTREGVERFRRTSFTVAIENNDPALAWTSTYSKLDGSLPLSDVPKFQVWNGSTPTSVVRLEIEVTTPGKVRLAMNSVRGLQLWVDGAPHDLAEQFDLELASGMHVLTLAIDRQRCDDVLRCEMLDVAGSPAQAQLVGGK
jgi:putative heme-binding domain-containing protein